MERDPRGVKLSGREDLNLRPFGPEPNALPDCATPRLVDATLCQIKCGESNLSVTAGEADAAQEDVGDEGGDGGQQGAAVGLVAGARAQLGGERQ